MCLWFRLWMRVITVCWWTIISPWRGGDAASTTFTPLKINKCNPATMRERAENESKGWRVWRGSLLSLTGISFFKEFFSVRRSCRDYDKSSHENSPNRAETPILKPLEQTGGACFDTPAPVMHDKCMTKHDKRAALSCKNIRGYPQNLLKKAPEARRFTHEDLRGRVLPGLRGCNGKIKNRPIIRFGFILDMFVSDSLVALTLTSGDSRRSQPLVQRFVDGGIG
jgi:hypothetical protein